MNAAREKMVRQIEAAMAKSGRRLTYSQAAKALSTTTSHVVSICAEAGIVLNRVDKG